MLMIQNNSFCNFPPPPPPLPLPPETRRDMGQILRKRFGAQDRAKVVASLESLTLQNDAAVEVESMPPSVAPEPKA